MYNRQFHFLGLKSQIYFGYYYIFAIKTKCVLNVFAA